MSIIDKVVAAVTPPESEQARAEARSKARAATRPGDWLSQILEHHLQIENAFAAVKGANSTGTRRLAEKRLGLLLTGHSNAEEAAVYPALALHDEKGHASAGYTEQSAVKIQMAALEKLEPMSQDYLDKLEHIRGAVAHHVFEEEGKWFLELKEKLSPTDASQITRRYKEEYERYIGKDAAA